MSEPTVQSGNAGDALVSLCESTGAMAFGVVSIHNQPLVDALDAADRYVPVRHEATCVSAADGYARASDGLGIAITSTGTGAGNAAGSLVEALTAGSSVVHVTGNIDAQYLGSGRGVIHETKAQLQMLEAVSKDAVSVLEASEVGDALLAAAGRSGAAPSGPVSVEIPIDVQYRETTWSLPVQVPPASMQALPDDLDRAAHVLASSQRPLLWVGGGGVGASEAVDRLTRLTGAGVITSNAGRGVLPESDDRAVGNFAATVGGAELLDEADCLLSVGTHFRSNETRHYKLELPTTHIQIDVDTAAIGRVYPTECSLVGDAALVLDALSDRIEAVGHSATNDAWVTRVTEARTRVREDLAADIGPYAALCDAMRSVLPLGSPLVRDVTIASSAWGNRLLEVDAPTTNINARGGGIGQGLGMAIGAATALPHLPTSLMVGDGGLALHLGELATVAQQQLWIVIILFNDGGYGVLRNLQDHHFDRRSGVDLLTPAFDQLAASFGLDYRLIATPDDCELVLTDAVGLRRGTIVEVDCNRFGDMPSPFVPPVPVQRS